MNEHYKDKRRFGSRQRADLFHDAQGKCALCNMDLTHGWHADHIEAWSKGGLTETINGQALCATCNLKKGNKEKVMSHEKRQPDREWQIEATDKYLSDNKQDWLLCAAPGAGKTRWALNLARKLLDNSVIDRIVIVAPSQTIRDQWTDQTIINLESVQNGDGACENRKDFQGIATTYQQVVSNPRLQRDACRLKTLVIFDEIHHAGFPNRSWGEKVKEAFEQASLRIGLTGTPWRRPGSGQIPFVAYDEQGKVCVDYSRSYGETVRDQACRSIEFRAYDGSVKYIYIDSCTNGSVVYSLEDEDDNTSILRDLLNPNGAWLNSMIQMGHQELMNIRRGDEEEGAIPDAKGVVFADSQKDARIIGEILERLAKETPAIIISDEPDAEAILNQFKKGTGKWAVAVNKISEGVDVPALYVGIYATRKKTPLNFRQMVGRLVRRRVDKNNEPRKEEGRPAVLFMPAVASLKELASEIEGELRHTLDIEREEYEQDLAKQGNLDFQSASENGKITTIPMTLSAAELAEVIYGGKSYSQAEYDKAQDMVNQHGFRSDDVIRVANLMRSIGMSTPITIETAEKVIEKVPQKAYKAALKSRINLLCRQKAAALGIENKEFNRDLLKRFGPRNELSIEELQKELHYLEEINVGLWAEELS